jgi:type III secretion system YscQ/HrcQ family protein
MTGPLGPFLSIGEPEALDRASGLRRPGVIARLVHPGRSLTLGLGIETQLAHALIDRLLGFPGMPGNERLPLTTVEWGLMGFVIVRTLSGLLSHEPAPSWTLERVGPDPFVPDGPCLTLHWPVRIAEVLGSVRLWLPPALLDVLPAPAPAEPGELLVRYGSLASTWRAVVGPMTLPRGLGRLRVGGVVPIDGAPLRGTTASPDGRVVLELEEPGVVRRFPAEIQPRSAAGRITLTGPEQREAAPREPAIMSAMTDPAASPADVPVTLTVELGRVSIPLHRLADLKPGDILELGRNAREPVELTSGGRLVARGELVQIDTELGVRVTSILM